MANQGANKGCYLNASELAAVEAAAAKAGITISAWIKQAIMKTLVRQGNTPYQATYPALDKLRPE